MIKKLLVLPLILALCNLHAQTIKTDVLVIGNGPSAVAAAMQSARSKVKTVLAAEKITLNVNEEKLAIEENNDAVSGIWGEFRGHLRDLYKTSPGFDTTHNAPLHLVKTDGEDLLKKMADTVKRLTLLLNTTFTTIQKNGDEWVVKVLKNGKAEEIKARIVVDATETGVITEKAGGKPEPRISFRQYIGDSNLFRTAIASGETWPPMGKYENALYQYWCIPLKNIVAVGVENLLVTDAILPAKKDPNNLPAELALGQGAGAAAAYCVFFKTSTAHFNVRTVQGELLDFKADLVPFVDIRPTDPDWRQIQQIALTGLLEPWGAFINDRRVSTAEIKPVLTETYTRAFLWFEKEKPGKDFTIANMLSFISDYTLTEPAILRASVQKAWKTQFKFNTDLEPNRPITRLEFAVLANKYLNPFARTVDLNGQLVN